MLRRLAPIQPDSFAFTPANLEWAQVQMSKYPEGRQQSAIIPVLWRAQEQEGWLSRPAIEYCAELLGMAYIRALEVATFYFMFQLQPVGSVAHIQICGTTTCMICGAGELIDVCRARIAPAPHTVAEACPFCHEPMPNPMSPALHALVQQWVQKSRAGKVLRPIDTLAVCQRHRDEHDIIPHGRRNGWPLELDFRALRRRITDPKHRYMRVLQDRLLDPERSPFFQEARRAREHMGKRASASAHQIDRFDEQQCG